MNKVAIFVEGQSELIFVRHFLPLVLGWEKISFECWELYANRTNPVSHKHTNKYAKTHFWILNVRNDEKVLSAVKDREEKLIQNGFKKIIALRDMYSQKYCNRAGHCINDEVTMAFVEGARKTVQQMKEPSKVKICFAIMELEAWFLGMYGIFAKMHRQLSYDYIENQLGFNLKTIDPQKEFFHPTDILVRILKLVNLGYDKSRKHIERLCSKMATTDFCNAFENARCESFRSFYEEIVNEYRLG